MKRVADDQARVHKWLDCIEALPNCEANNADAFEKSFLGCATSPLRGVSQACLDGIAGGGD